VRHEFRFNVIGAKRGSFMYQPIISPGNGSVLPIFAKYLAISRKPVVLGSA
jgi:hypothetical protein